MSYAYRVPAFGGVETLILVADRRAWLWWDHGIEADMTEYPFTVFQVQLDRNGAGEAKSSHTASVAVDHSLGLVLEDLESQPVLLADVRRKQR